MSNHRRGASGGAASRALAVMTLDLEVDPDDVDDDWDPDVCLFCGRPSGDDDGIECCVTCGATGCTSCLEHGGECECCTARRERDS